MTSSKMRSAPVRSATRRRPSRKPARGGTHLSRDQRTPRADEVDVLVAVGVAYAGPLARDDEGRFAADGAEGAHRTGYAAGHELFGAIVQPRVRRGERH